MWFPVLAALSSRCPAFSFLLWGFCPCLVRLLNFTWWIKLFQGHCVCMHMLFPVAVGNIQLLFSSLFFFSLDWILLSSPSDYMTVLMYWCGRMRLSGVFWCHLIDWLSRFHYVWSDAVDNFKILKIATLLCLRVWIFDHCFLMRILQRRRVSGLQAREKLCVTSCPTKYCFSDT